MLRPTVIIPTYNRPKELQDCLRSIIDQTVKPYEVIIVDDGDLNELPLEKEFKDLGIPYLYLKKDRPGLTESRNVGVSAASGDIIFFLDDDVVLCPNYIEEIIKVYEHDKKGVIRGAGGSDTDASPLKFVNRLNYIYDLFFLNSGFNEGKVLPSGFCTEFGTTEFPIRSIREVDFLAGGICSYRKEIFDEFSFTEKYHQFGDCEDKDFSYQVSRKYKVVFNPKARLFHYPSPEMRPDKLISGRKFVIGKYLFFTTHIKKSWWSWLFFYYALFGYFLKRVVIMIFSFDRGEIDRVKGILGAVRDIVTKRISIR